MPWCNDNNCILTIKNIANISNTKYPVQSGKTHIQNAKYFFGVQIINFFKIVPIILLSIDRQTDIQIDRYTDR
jgi:hypothetical protein